jgi:hypothetical protein
MPSGASRACDEMGIVLARRVQALCHRSRGDLAGTFRCSPMRGSVRLCVARRVAEWGQRD